MDICDLCFLILHFYFSFVFLWIEIYLISPLILSIMIERLNRCQFHQRFSRAFFVRMSFRQLFSSYVWLGAKILYKKCARLMLMKLTIGCKYSNRLGGQKVLLLKSLRLNYFFSIKWLKIVYNFKSNNEEDQKWNHVVKFLVQVSISKTYFTSSFFVQKGFVKLIVTKFKQTKSRLINLFLPIFVVFLLLKTYLSFNFFHHKPFHQSENWTYNEKTLRTRKHFDYFYDQIVTSWQYIEIKWRLLDNKGSNTYTKTNMYGHKERQNM
jgi:hypothetical protein